MKQTFEIYLAEKYRPATKPAYSNYYLPKDCDYPVLHIDQIKIKYNNIATPVKETEPDVIPEVLAEVREYTNLPIILTDTEFPSNHLFCKRGKYCEFTELSKYVEVYVYPTYQKDKQEQTEPAPTPTSKEGLEDAKFTAGEWKARGTTRGLNGFYVGTDTQNIAQVYSSIPECEANARLIAAAPAMFEALKDCLKCLTMDSDMEEDFAPEIKKAKAILTRINKY